MSDSRIKKVDIFPATTKSGKVIFNGNIEFAIDPVMSIYFKLSKLPKNDGSGYYFQWPQEVYNKELAQETNYQKGVNKFIFGNKGFGMAIQEAFNEKLTQMGLDPNTGQQVQRPVDNTTNFGSATIETFEDVNTEEIKF